MKAATPAESADGLCTESEAAGARTEDPGADYKVQRLRTPRRVATSLKPTSCWPPWKASTAMEINILLFFYLDLTGLSFTNLHISSLTNLNY